MNVGLLLKSSCRLNCFFSSLRCELKNTTEKNTTKELVVFSSCDIIYELQSEELCFLFDSIHNCLHNGCIWKLGSYSHIKFLVSRRFFLSFFLFTPLSFISSDSTLYVRMYGDERSTLCHNIQHANECKRYLVWNII